jgi:hypothetical protein
VSIPLLAAFTGSCASQSRHFVPIWEFWVKPAYRRVAWCLATISLTFRHQ